MKTAPASGRRRFLVGAGRIAGGELSPASPTGARAACADSVASREARTGAGAVSGSSRMKPEELPVIHGFSVCAGTLARGWLRCIDGMGPITCKLVRGGLSGECRPCEERRTVRTWICNRSVPPLSLCSYVLSRVVMDDPVRRE